MLPSQASVLPGVKARAGQPTAGSVLSEPWRRPAAPEPRRTGASTRSAPPRPTRCGHGGPTRHGSRRGTRAGDSSLSRRRTRRRPRRRLAAGRRTPSRCRRRPQASRAPAAPGATPRRRSAATRFRMGTPRWDRFEDVPTPDRSTNIPLSRRRAARRRRRGAHNDYGGSPFRSPVARAPRPAVPGATRGIRRPPGRGRAARRGRDPRSRCPR